MRPIAPTLGLCLLAASASAQTTVFFDDFSGALPAGVSPGAAGIEGVQGYAGLGPTGNTFGGTFLRSPTGNVLTVQLTGLPPHNAIHLDFLFAAIDSLDGTGSFPSGDFFKITLDGNTIFRESFANATPSQIQSYVSPPGVELARRIDLGFTGPGSFYTDSAYWLGGDPVFQDIGHSAATATFTFVIEGPGIQSLSDESWAMDNLRVTIDSAVNPGSAVAYGTSCGPILSATTTPRVGQPLPVLLLNLAPGTVLAGCEMGLSDTVYGGNPLPLALDSIGLTGCSLLHDLALGNLPMTLLGNAASSSPVIPAVPAIAGVAVFLQGWNVAPNTNPANILASNGLRVTIGQ